MYRSSYARPDGWLSRRGRRILLLVLLLGLVALLVQSLYVPFQHPRTHLILLTGGLTSQDRSSAGPLDFVIEDFSDFVSLEPALYRGPFGPGMTILGSLRDRDEMSGLGDQIATLPVRHNDVLLIFVSAAGISTDGTPLLVGAGHGGARGPGGDEFRYPLRTLLKQIQTSPARHKLLILDAGRSDFDPESGMLVNQFPRLLREEVELLQDAGLSVLCSHDELQRSNLSPALRRSVFAYFVVSGLQGSADLNGDRVVSLDELERFVSQQVAAWVQRGSGGRDSQTPFLVQWSGAPPRGTLPLLAVTAARHDGVRDHHLATIAANRRESRLATAGVDSTRREANRFVRAQMERVRPQSRFSRLATTYVPQFWRERTIWFGGDETPAIRGDDSAELDLATMRDSELDGEDLGSDPPQADSVPPVSTSNGTKAANSGGVSAGENDSDLDPGLKVAPAAAASGSGEATNAAPAASPASPLVPSGEEIPVVDPRVIEALLHELWALRDRLETVPRFPYRPQDFAPHLWRAFQQQLLLRERLFRTGPVDARTQLEQTLITWRDELRTIESRSEGVLDRPLTILQRLRAAHPSRIDAHPFAHSLAMKELIYRRRNLPLPDDLRELQGNLDRWLVEGTLDEFVAWADGLSVVARQMPEFRLAHALRTRGHLDWSIIQLAMRVAREAERTVANGGRFARWLELPTLAADQRRQAAEQRLLDGLHLDLNPARAELTSLLAVYRGIDQQREQLEQAGALRNDVMFRLPDYVQWFQRTPALNTGNTQTGPRFDDLKQLLVDLRNLCDQLDGHHRGPLTDLVTTSERLRSRRDMLERPLDEESVRLLASPPVQSGDSWQIEQLLSNSLARADARRRLIRGSAEIDRSWAADFVLPETTPHVLPRPQMAAEDWQRVEQLMELETRWVQLAIPIEETGHVLESIVKRVESRREAFPKRPVSGGETLSEDSERWRIASEFGAELRSFHQSLPGHLQGALARESEPSPVGFQAAEADSRSFWWRLAWWLDPRDERKFPDVVPSSRDERDATRQLLVWQFRRAMSARIGQDGEEFAYLTGVAFEYARGVGAGGPPSPVLAIPPRRLDLEGTSSLSLALQQESEVEVTIRNQSAAREEVWLVLEYAEELLEVRPRGASTVPLYSDREMPPDRVRLAVADLIWRDSKSTVQTEIGDFFSSRAPSLTLRGGQREAIRLRVRRRAETPHPTRLVVTAYSKSEVVRWVLPIQLPAPREIEFRVAGTPGSWSTVDPHVSLHPFPNRVTRFQLELRCQPGHEKKVDVELFVPRGPLPNIIPGAMLRMADADAFLTTLSLGSPLREARDLTLVGTDGWQPIPWTEPKPDPAKAETSETPGATEGVTEASRESPAETRVVDSLLVVVTDRERQQRMFSRLDVAPQKPTRFVRPRVTYDPTRQRLDVEILPQDRDLLPPEAIRIRAEFSPELPESSERRLDTILEAPQYRGQLYAEIPPEPQSEVTLYLHVDDYPRAFVFQIPLDRFALDIPPDDQFLRIHISNLPLGTVYRAPVGRIPVDVEVDVPRGGFRNSRDFFEVGVDRSRDRLLVGEPSQRLFTDRQVIVTVTEITDDGVLILATRVTDQHVELTDIGHQGGRANILARLFVGGREVWSDPVEIILDGAGPRFLTAELTTDGVVAMGTEVGVVTRVDDRSLSGVARVEMAIDRARSGQLPEEGRVEAELDASGAWRANIPTDGLSRGAYNVLLQATDRVGNVGEVRRIRVQLVSEDDLKPDASALRGVIRGSVLFGRSPREAFPVTLEQMPDESREGENGGDGGAGKTEEGSIRRSTRTDSAGVFIFRDLPAGSYQLRAAGIVHNRPRSAEKAVKLAPPEMLPPVELTLP